MNGSNARYRTRARSAGYRMTWVRRGRGAHLIGIVLIAVGLIWLYDTLRQSLGAGDGLFFGALDLMTQAGTDGADVMTALTVVCGILAAYALGRIR